MRFQFAKENGYVIVRIRNNEYEEIAYGTLGVHGLQAEIEFPSDWHEHRRAWVRLGLIIGSINFSFPWKWVVEDHHQCSGPTYGFTFYSDLLWIDYGKSKGLRSDPRICISMPWSWAHKEHKILSEKETHSYRYVLKSGEVQERQATINAELRRWSRWWIPFKKVVRSIDVTFSDEVGERSGSWKGGCIGCGYEMLPNERPVDTLRRMEHERKF